jgi:hypothetical protein
VSELPLSNHTYSEILFHSEARLDDLVWQKKLFHADDVCLEPCLLPTGTMIWKNNAL